MCVLQNCFLKSKSSKKELSVATMLDTAMVVKPKDPKVDNKKVENENEDEGNKKTDNTQTNIMIIIAVSVSGFIMLVSIGFLCWWVHRRRTYQKRLQSLPVGVMPISHRDRDRMDEKYEVRASVDWNECDRKSLLSGKAETVGKPTPVYEIRRKGDSYHVE